MSRKSIFGESVTNTFKANYEIDDHLLSIADIASKYSVNFNKENISNSNGLSEINVPNLQKIHGKNILSPPKQIPEWLKILHHFLDLFNLLLLFGAILSFLAYILDESDDLTSLYLAFFLLFIVFFDTVIGYVQERSSSNVMGKFKTMMPLQSTVIRDGKEQVIAAEDIVVGELIKIQGGNKIPADLRIIYNRGLKVEQSALNGESEPVEIVENSLSPNFIESRNIVFNGCLCLEGIAYGIAIKTGDNTYLGIIAQQTAQIQSSETPLQKEIKSFVKFITILGVTLGLIVFIIGGLQGNSDLVTLFVQGFLIVIIANIPQGLPATVISCLTIIAYRMSKQNVYIKKLESIETLGSATVIATDKTGTLTMNKMTVEHIWIDAQVFSADYIKKNYLDFKKNKAWNRIFKIGSLCNKAFFQIKKENADANPEQVQIEIPEKNKNDNLLLSKNEPRSDNDNLNYARTNSLNSRKLLKKLSTNLDHKEEDSMDSENFDHILTEIKAQQNIELKKFQEINSINEKRKELPIIGDATETAILRFCDSFANTDNYREKYRKIFELPFNSKNKFQLSIHEYRNHQILVLKGAPEIVFSKCTSFTKYGKIHEMNAEFKEDFEEAYSLLGSKGERVLGCAYADLGKNNGNIEYSVQKNNIPMEKLCFIGMYSLMDPPKKGVADAILKAKKAGLKVFMITGDHPLTAEAIARKVNIIGEFETLEEIAIKNNCKKEDLDPNLALASIISGHDLTKFTEDNWKDLLLSKRELVFARISPQQKVEIVENLQKIKEIVIVTGDGVNDAIALKKADIGVAMGKEGTDVAKEAAEVVFMDDNVQILNSLTLLTIDLGTELGPAISLAYEEAEGDIMNRPPRNINTDRLMSFRLISYSYLQAGFIITFYCFFGYFWVYSDYGIGIGELPFLSPTYFSSSTNQVYVSESGREYSVEEQLLILNTAATAYYIACVMGQFFNIWMCKTRQQSFVTHILKNSMTIYGVIIEILIMATIVYVPEFQDIFSTANVGKKYWWVCLWCGVTLIAYNETRKFWTRKYPNGKIAKYFLW